MLSVRVKFIIQFNYGSNGIPFGMSFPTLKIKSLPLWTFYLIKSFGLSVIRPLKIGLHFKNWLHCKYRKITKRQNAVAFFLDNINHPFLMLYLIHQNNYNGFYFVWLRISEGPQLVSLFFPSRHKQMQVVVYCSIKIPWTKTFCVIREKNCLSFYFVPNWLAIWIRLKTEWHNNWSVKFI